MKRKKLSKVSGILMTAFLMVLAAPSVQVSAAANVDVTINEENFPDANFRTYVEDNYDTSGNGILEVDELNAVTAINVDAYERGFKVTSVKGIEYFPNLVYLNCEDHESITELDISQNLNLKSLYCGGNSLTTLDLSGHNLEELDCGGNNLTSLDLSSCTSLVELNCSSNDLTALDLSQNLLLSELRCGYNNVVSLNVDANVNLTHFQCQSNGITTINLANNIKLDYIDCSENELTTLDISNQTELETLWCQKNKLTTLDLSMNTKLEGLGCEENNITTLDVSVVPTLTFLRCNNNQITSLNVNTLSGLKTLICGNNPINTIDVKNNTNLELLELDNTLISTIDISKNTKLVELDINTTPLIALNVEKNTALEKLDFSYTDVSEINLSENANLKELRCGNTKLTTLNLSNNVNLVEIICEDCKLKELELGTKPNLRYISARNNQLMDVDFSNVSSSDVAAAMGTQEIDLGVIPTNKIRIQDYYSGFDPSKVLFKTNAAYNATTGVFTVYEGHNEMSYQYSIEIPNDDDTNVTIDLRFTIAGQAPTITSHPSSVNVENGTDMSFNVTATGDNLTYQWYWAKDDSAVANGTNISGSTTANLTINAYNDMCDLSGESVYCVVTNSEGNAKSNTASMTVTHKAASNSYEKDADNHWHECACGEKMNSAAHTFEWVSDKAATTTEAGSKHEECSVCGYEKAPVEIQPNGTGVEVPEPEDEEDSEEGEDTSDDENTAPSTGDDNIHWIWLLAMTAISGAFLGFMAYDAKKEHKVK